MKTATLAAMTALLFGSFALATSVEIEPLQDICWNGENIRDDIDTSDFACAKVLNYFSMVSTDQLHIQGVCQQIGVEQRSCPVWGTGLKNVEIFHRASDQSVKLPVVTGLDERDCTSLQAALSNLQTKSVRFQSLCKSTGGSGASGRDLQVTVIFK